MDRVQATSRVRKRKAESQDNERLTKRLSLLNLGLYISFVFNSINSAWADELLRAQWREALCTSWTDDHQQQQYIPTLEDKGTTADSRR
jgi:hypothetical protein